MPEVGVSEVSQVVRRRAPAPVAPAEYSKRSAGDSAIDDRSRWAHGIPPVKAFRNRAAVIDPGPFELFTESAIGVEIRSSYSAGSGIRHSSSPDTRPASARLSASASSVANIPPYNIAPSETLIAP